MDVFDVIGALAAIGLLAYLCFALVNPEDLS